LYNAELKTLKDPPPLLKIPSLIAVTGPTGSGKSELALHLARIFEGEVVNCDSLQVYRFFDIGTAKLPVVDRLGVPHHLMDIVNPDEIFTAGDFARAARPVLREIAQRGRLPIVTGGTGFYLRALIEGLAPGPGRDEALRNELQKREARQPGCTHRLLRRVDPQTAARIHANDLPKVIRALEICLTARRPATEVFSEGRDALEGFRVLKIGLFPDRQRLYQRLESRMEAMFAQGLIEETASILARGYAADCKPFESIGYKQALDVLNGKLSSRDALFYATRETRRYAKRQMTWFRQEPGIVAISGFGGEDNVSAKAEVLVREFLTAGTDNLKL
jgi:tRNA dimethylallyltransferase